MRTVEGALHGPGEAVYVVYMVLYMWKLNPKPRESLPASCETQSVCQVTVHLFCVLGRAVWESEVESGTQTYSGDGGGEYVTKLELP